MALREEDLSFGTEAVVYRFPLERARSRAARARMLERRRRSLAFLLAVLLVSALAWQAASPGAGAASASRAPQVVTVRPGQTPWDLAERYAAPGVDSRSFVDDLLEVNDATLPLQPGSKLELPD